MFFKKSLPLITKEQSDELRKIEQEAYMEKAKELIRSRGEKKAINDIAPELLKPKREDSY